MARKIPGANRYEYRVQTAVPESVLRWLEAECERRGMTESALLRVLLTEAKHKQEKEAA